MHHIISWSLSYVSYVVFFVVIVYCVALLSLLSYVIMVCNLSLLLLLSYVSYVDIVVVIVVIVRHLSLSLSYVTDGWEQQGRTCSTASGAWQRKERERGEEGKRARGRCGVLVWRRVLDVIWHQSNLTDHFHLPGKTFQNLNVSSPAPVTIVWPHGDIARYNTRILWPVNVATFLIVGYFQMMIWWWEYPWVETISLMFLENIKLHTWKSKKWERKTCRGRRSVVIEVKIG